MQTRTRSQSKLEKKTIYSVFIDFDEASKEWNANKRKVGDGCYKYLCIHKCKSGLFCKREPKKGNHYCSAHLTE
jgi:hypothetical protein